MGGRTRSWAVRKRVRIQGVTLTAAEVLAWLRCAEGGCVSACAVVGEGEADEGPRWSEAKAASSAVAGGACG